MSLARAFGGAALWALLYNLVWGVAWFTFMRAEWLRAATSVSRPMPWTAEIWVVWVVCTFPIGAAVTAYAASHLRSAVKHAVTASLAAWMLLAAGTAISFVQAHFSIRIVAMDSAVSLIGMLVAALAMAVCCRRIESKTT